MTEGHAHRTGWHVFDLLIVGCVGVALGLLLAALAARDRLPVPEAIDAKE